MVTNFEFATATRIVFGNGCISALPKAVRELGRRVLVVTGSNPTRTQRVLDSLPEQELIPILFPVSGEPTIAIVQSGAERARAAACDCVLAIGGGSVIDAAKAISALATNGGDVLDYLEVIGRAQPLAETPLPFVAAPTTAGTGAEVTRNAVLFSPEHRVKASLRGPRLLARAALVDPELTHDLPPALTASTGMDALTQLIEPFVCSRANPLTDTFAREGLPRVARSLQRAFEEPRNREARTDMALASLLGGLALANAGLGAVHGFAAPIGGMFRAPHGAVCAALLADVMEENIRTAREQSAAETLRRYDEIARLLTGDPHADGGDGVKWVRQLCLALKIPRLGAFEIQARDFEAIAKNALASSSMKANPVALSPAQLAAILERAH